MNQSLFEKIGGEAAVDAAVDLFYRKLLLDDRVSHYFENISIERQAAKQKAFLTMAFGGPQNYNGKNMRDAHTNLVSAGLSHVHFDAVLENLGETLKELSVPDEHISEVKKIAESTRNDVLGL